MEKNYEIEINGKFLNTMLLFQFTGCYFIAQNSFDHYGQQTFTNHPVNF